MRWRELAYNAAITLIITVVAGVLVWLVTREPPSAEQLRYSIQDEASFALGTSRIGIVAAKIANTGNKVAHDVNIAIVFSSEVELREKQVSLSSGPAGTFEGNSRNPHALDVIVKTLAPGEVLTASMLVGGNPPFRPTVGVKSADTVGSEGDLEPQKSTDISKLISFIAAALLIGFPPLFFLFTKDSFFEMIGFSRSSINNTAFIFNQIGEYEKAKKLLETTITARGAGPYELANLATANGLAGDLEAAEKDLKASEWWGRSRGFRALVSYNRATLLASQGKDQEAKEALAKAYALSPRSIAEYFRLSVYFADASKRDPEYKTIIGAG